MLIVFPDVDGLLKRSFTLTSGLVYECSKECKTAYRTRTRDFPNGGIGDKCLSVIEPSQCISQGVDIDLRFRMYSAMISRGSGGS